MQSLYDALHVENPERPGAAVDPWPENPSPKQFAELVVNSIEFRQYLIIGIRSGQLAPAVMCRLLDHAWGKPVEQVEVTNKTLDFSKMSKNELLERIAVLQSLVQELPDEHSHSVH